MDESYRKKIFGYQQKMRISDWVILIVGIGVRTFEVYVDEVLI